MAVDWRVVGPTHVTVHTTTTAQVRLKFGSNTDVTTGVIYTSLQTRNTPGVTRHAIPGSLTPGPWYYRVEEGGTLDTLTPVGRVIVPDPTPGDFSFCFAACCDAADSAAMTHIAGRGDDVFIHMGDLYYADGTGQTIANFRSKMAAKLAAANHQKVLATTLTAYTSSDHDFGMVDDGTAGSAPGAVAPFNQAYRELYAHGAIPATTGTYYYFDHKGVRFIIWDCRSFSSHQNDTDNSSKSKLGATQKAWTKNLITTLPAGYACVIVSDTAWSGPKTANDDAWIGFTTERTELANYIAASDAARRTVIIAGDMHALAYDNGVNSPGNLPLFQAAPLNNNSSIKGGSWSGGTYPTSAGTTILQQYGRITITRPTTGPSGTTRLAFAGYSSTGTSRITGTVTLQTPVAGAGTTPVTAQRQSQWNTRARVTSTRPAQWRTLATGSVSSSVVTRWRTEAITKVTATRATTWNVRVVAAAGTDEPMTLGLIPMATS